MDHAYTQTHDALGLSCLTAEQRARTCGYWYTVTANGGTPHTAFRTKPALLQWLEARGLSVEGEIPDPGEYAWKPINGSYRTALHRSYDEFFARNGARQRGLQNGDYTLAIITIDEDGQRTEHKLNPNNHDRPTFPHRESDALIDAGQAHADL